MDATELDRWRKAHPTYSYWCGIQLGGCGGELSDKRYTHKVCHFAHHPNAPICYRTANGESSADHLFIKRGVQRLLSKQKLSAKVQTQNLGTGPGDAVDVHLPRARRRLRFQLSGLDYPAWRRAVDDLTDGTEDLDWIFGPDTPVTRELAGRHGFCLRVRCETVGGERRVHIGAETPDRTGAVQWTPLEDCVLTPTGLTTPDVETIRISRPRPKLHSFPIQGSLVFTPVLGANAPTHSPFATEDRHLLVADVRPLDSPIVRALLSLPGDTDAPPAEHVYRVPDSARMLVLEDDHGWAIEANRYMRLNAHDAQQTGLWSPPPGMHPEPGPSHAPISRSTKVAEPQALAKPKAAPLVATTTVEPPAKPRPHTHADLVTQLRDTLADLARMRSTTTWAALARTIGWGLSNLSDIEHRDLLVEVDSPLSEYIPVRSALIRHDGGPLPYLGDILHRLGVPFAKGSPQLKRWAAVETDRAFAAYGQPARAMGPRLDLTPHSLPQGQVAKALRAWKTPPVTAPTRRTAPTATSKRQDAQLSELLAELSALRPGLSKPARKRANKAIMGARVRLGELPVQRVPRRVKAASQSRAHHIQALQNALKDARKDIAQAEFLSRHQDEQRKSTVPTAESPAPKREVPPPELKQLSRAELRIRRGLIDTASRRETISLLDLPGARTLRDASLLRMLTDMDRGLAPDAPLLSALATGPDGGPVPFFRQILKDVGLAVPQADEALMAIWRREQERAHAKYAYPAQPLPPRLVPPA
ncbi:hypothetical protein PV728_12795 [Streptomyces europaeiscabiei]|nr:hypothetical protein [Streptomyces europaeiscabiei]MDX3631153.1 hypothetical protein [Streptomyces europaeiscabiei]MDX3647633.1 hypothetical protein [Streptomyces europaeiscabiei]